MSPCSRAFDHPLAGRGQDAGAGGEADGVSLRKTSVPLPSSAVQCTKAPVTGASRLNEATIVSPLSNSSICLPPLPRPAEAIVPELTDVRSSTSVGVDARAHAHAADGAVGLERGQRARVELQFRTLVGPVVDDLSRTNCSSQRQCRCIVDRGCQIAGQVPVDRKLTAEALTNPRPPGSARSAWIVPRTDDRAGASDRDAARVDQRASIEFDGARADGLRLVDRERAGAADLQCLGRIAQLDRTRGGYRAAELQDRVHIDRQCGAAEDRVADVEGAAGRAGSFRFRRSRHRPLCRTR